MKTIQKDSNRFDSSAITGDGSVEDFERWNSIHGNDVEILNAVEQYIETNSVGKKKLLSESVILTKKRALVSLLMELDPSREHNDCLCRMTDQLNALEAVTALVKIGEKLKHKRHIVDCASAYIKEHQLGVRKFSKEPRKVTHTRALFFMLKGLHLEISSSEARTKLAKYLKKIKNAIMSWDAKKQLELFEHSHTT
jgi:hypothetical protein